VEPGVGTTLREARNRRKIDLSEVEGAIKIRVRFLRAMENEEWDALPGGVYSVGFIRTYASYLGLDGERLADECRRCIAPAIDEQEARIEPAGLGRMGTAPRVSTWVWVVAVSAVLIGVMVTIGLAGGGEDSAPSPAPNARHGGATGHGANEADTVAVRRGVALWLRARGEVWVCLLDDAEEPLVDGQILMAGAEEGPFRSGSFTVSFGNGEVMMRVDGRQAQIPATSSPLGYGIDGDGEMTQLEETERPTCA
jgi:hypothetical protein